METGIFLRKSWIHICMGAYGEKTKPFTVIPPSMQIVWPVMKEAAGRQRNATNEDTSFGSATLPIGVREMIVLNIFSSLRNCNIATNNREKKKSLVRDYLYIYNWIWELLHLTTKIKLNQEWEMKDQTINIGK